MAPAMNTSGKISHGAMKRYAVSHWRQKRRREGRRTAPPASTAMCYCRSGLVVVASLSSAAFVLDFLSMIDSSALLSSSLTLPVFALEWLSGMPYGAPSKIVIVLRLGCLHDGT